MAGMGVSPGHAPAPFVGGLPMDLGAGSTWSACLTSPDRRPPRRPAVTNYKLSQRNLARALIVSRAARGTARTVAANVMAMEQAIVSRASTAPDAGASRRLLYGAGSGGSPDPPGASRSARAAYSPSLAFVSCFGE